MRRLAARLALAMLLVATVSLSVTVVSQVFVAREAAGRLPIEIRQRMAELGPDREAWFLRGRPVPTRLAGDPVTLTLTESVRAIDRVQSAQWRGLAYGLALAGLCSGALAWWLARGIARPIAAIGVAASRVGAGDLEARVPPPGAPLGVAAEVAELTDAFNRMAETLERAERERQALVADVAHELRTPITAMALRLQALRDGLVSFDVREVERLARQTALLHRLVEDLRTLSLADAGRLTLRSDRLEVARLLLEASEAVAPLAAVRHVDIVIEPAGEGPDGEPVSVVGDAERLRQVLINVLDNGVRASPEGGTVRLAAVAESDRVTVSVCDEGPGFAMADLPHVFERFRQGEAGRRDVRGHTGLGLAIVRAIVELHEGEVRASNRSGGGAEVSLQLRRG